MAEISDGQYREGSQCIGLERDGELVAGALVDNYNGASMHCHIALADKRSLSREFLQACFRYAFEQAGCRVLIAPVAKPAAQRLVERIGFRFEHSIASAHPSGDLRIYTMRRSECRWL